MLDIKSDKLFVNNLKVVFIVAQYAYRLNLIEEIVKEKKMRLKINRPSSMINISINKQ